MKLLLRTILFLSALSIFLDHTSAAQGSISSTPLNNESACTQEAMLCPDGKTWAGRTGPSCEFQCPSHPPVDIDDTISLEIQERLNKKLNDLYKRLERKFNNSTDIKNHLNALIVKLKILGTKKSEYTKLINFVINHIESYISTLTENIFDDIFNILQ